MINVIDKSRAEQLKELLFILAKQIDDNPGARDMASLARQYRETLKEIEGIKGSVDEGDEIASILSERDDNGKPGAVR